MSQAFLNLTLQQMPGFAATLEGPEHRFTYVNDAYVEISGDRGFVGRTVREVFPELESQGFYDLLDQVYETGERFSARAMPIQLDREAGESDRFVDLLYEPIRDDTGAVSGIFVGGYDVTEAERAARALRQSEERYRTVFGAATTGLCIVQMKFDENQVPIDYMIVDGNAAFEEMTGLKNANGKWVSEIAPGLERHWFERYGGVALTGQPARFEAPADIFGRWYDVQAHRLGPAEDQRVAILFDNITERRDAEAARHEAETRYRTLFETIDEGFCIIEFVDGPNGPLSDYVHIEANKAYTLNAGIPDIVGKRLSEIVGDEAGEWLALYKGVLDTGEPIRFEKELEATGRWLELAAFRVGRREQRQVAVLFKDLTRRKAAEKALADNEEMLRLALAAGGQGAWALDLPTLALEASDHCKANFGRPADQPFTYQMLRDSVLPDDQTRMQESVADAIETGGVYDIEYRIARLDGSQGWVHIRGQTLYDADGAPSRMVGVSTDITARKQAEIALRELNENLELRVVERTEELSRAHEALRQSQKMEAVGQLTGGIAHDFNNLLAGISGSLELLNKRLAEGRTSGMERYIDAAQGAAQRAAALTQRLLAFSRRQTLDPRTTDVNRLIGGMEELVRRSVGPDIEVEVVGAGGLWPVRIDQSQLENALLNLCINARDAMAPDGGRLTIETANKWLDDRAGGDRDLLPGQYVSLCVTDTGSGMAPETIEKIFDPFFTTKPLGQGTGLGLSMIHGFVRQSGGQVRVYSEVGKGTTMCLYLPRHFGELDEADPVSIALDAAPGHGETVLVIDDEPTVRMLVVEVLQEQGYVVLEAPDGPTGLRILETDARIDLLISDVGLPGGMNGRQVADAARVNRPDLKVLFITGYAENAAVGNGLLAPGMEVLTKPFVMSDLAAKATEMIDG